MNKLYIVYDFLTTMGYLPFTYLKKDLKELLKNTLNNKLSIKDRYKNHTKILTNELTFDILNDNSNTILVVVKPPKVSVLDGFNLDNVISKKLKKYMKIYDNFKLVKS